jgi:hypothetical protein
MNSEGILDVKEGPFFFQKEPASPLASSAADRVFLSLKYRVYSISL